MERKYSDKLKIQIVNEYLTTYETYVFRKGSRMDKPDIFWQTY